MFDIASTMLSGSVSDLDKSIDGILIGSGLARKLSLKTGDRVRLVCFNGASKMLRVMGVFRTTIKSLDDTKTYVNIPVVQQLLQKDRNYITDIYINIRDHTQSPAVGGRLGQLTGYTAEAWQTANQQSLAARQIRDIIANAMIMAILVVAGFGIYNILNMVIYEKIKEIAILKATGFAGKHIVSVFIGQALFIGIFGSFLGLALGYMISFGVSRIYIGLGNVSYLPMAFYTRHYIQGLIFGITTAFFAGYVPSVKASKVDPVKIIRG
jgi:lipoprotein-releasing system permease protein